MNANWMHMLTQMAGQQGAEGQNPYGGFVMLAIMFAIFYFLLIRPQQKRMKEHQNMISNLQKGLEVVTTGGLIGKITAITDDEVTLQVADNVKIKIQKSAVQQVRSQTGENKGA